MFCTHVCLEFASNFFQICLNYLYYVFQFLIYVQTSKEFDIFVKKKS
jgi:hypothetical protein